MVQRESEGVMRKKRQKPPEMNGDNEAIWHKVDDLQDDVRELRGYLIATLILMVSGLGGLIGLAAT